MTVIYFTDSVLEGPSIAVLVIVAKTQHLTIYHLAQSTLACYCKMRNYEYILVVLDQSPEWDVKCPQKDVSFNNSFPDWHAHIL